MSRYYDVFSNRSSGRYPEEFQDLPLDGADDIFVGDLDPDGGGLFQNSFGDVDPKLMNLSAGIPKVFMIGAAALAAYYFFLRK